MARGKLTRMLGDIANGIDERCFADQENFSVLGIWNSARVHLHNRESR